MSTYRKYRCLWAVPLPPGAGAPDGPVDVMGAEFDEFKLADWHAKYQAKQGPMPAWWAVIEVRRKPARSVLRDDRWEVSQMWEAGRPALELSRPDFEYLRGADSSAA